MAVGDSIPYGIHIAVSPGSVNKAVKKIQIAPAQGSINKEITGVWIAPNQGAINKKIFIGGGRYGDVNNDGSISISDYTLIRLHYLGLSLLNQEEQNRADVDRDGDIDEADDDLVRAYILGL